MSSFGQVPGVASLAGFEFNEVRLDPYVVTNAALTAAAQQRRDGLVIVSVVGTYTLTGGAGTVRMILEGSNDGTTWFVIAQQADTQLFTLTGDVQALNPSANDIVNLARFRQLRVRAAIVTGAPVFSLSAQVSGITRGGVTVLLSSPALTRTAAVVNDTAFDRLGGAAFATVQAVMAGIALGGANSFLVSLQGSLDGGTTFITIASVNFTINGSFLLSGDNVTLIPLAGYDTLRFRVEDVGGVGGGYTVNLFLCYDSADAKGGDQGQSDDSGSIPQANTTFITVINDPPTAEAANARDVTFRLMQADGSPLLDARRIKVLIYDTSGSGDVDLSTNGTVSVVVAGTLIAGLGTNVVAVETTAAGIATVRVLDAATETIFATVVDNGLPLVADRQCIVQTVEVSLVYA